MISELIEKRLNSRFPTGQTFAKHDDQEIGKFWQGFKIALYLIFVASISNAASVILLIVCNFTHCV